MWSLQIFIMQKKSFCSYLKQESDTVQTTLKLKSQQHPNHTHLIPPY